VGSRVSWELTPRLSLVQRLIQDPALYPWLSDCAIDGSSIPIEIIADVGLFGSLPCRSPWSITIASLPGLHLRSNNLLLAGSGLLHWVFILRIQCERMKVISE
jgi:hypothetical protein